MSHDTLRLFIALELPPALAAQLEAEQRWLQAGHPPVKWVGAGAFHLTLQFLGSVPMERVSALQSALEAAAAGVDRFTLRLHGLGTFPNPRRPRVIWAGLQGEIASLLRLQARVVAGNSALGFKPEERPFSPHLTLGRVREGADRSAIEQLGRMVMGRQLEPEEPWPVESVALIRSELLPGGARYTALCHAALGQATTARAG